MNSSHLDISSVGDESVASCRPLRLRSEWISFWLWRGKGAGHVECYKSFKCSRAHWIFFMNRRCEANPQISAKSQLFEYLFCKLGLHCLFRKWTVVPPIYWGRNTYSSKHTLTRISLPLLSLSPTLSISLHISFSIFLQISISSPSPSSSPSLSFASQPTKIIQREEAHETKRPALPILKVP